MTSLQLIIFLFLPPSHASNILLFDRIFAPFIPLFFLSYFSLFSSVSPVSPFSYWLVLAVRNETRSIWPKDHSIDESFVIEDFEVFGFQLQDYTITGGEDSVGIQDFSVLPFGPIEDPVRRLMLSTTWPQLSEHLVTETESYSDLDPLQVGIVILS